MKIKKITKYKNKLFKLKLIQTKIINNKYFLNNIKLEDIEYKFKQILQIIYKYHIFNKRILFIGAPLKMNQKLNSYFNKTKHIFIPHGIWSHGALNNKRSYFKNLSKNLKNFNNKILELLFQFKKNIDLIVVLDETTNLNIINEGYTARIPIISFNSNFHNTKSNYKVVGNFQFLQKKIRDKFFYFILTSTLKKGTNYKKFIYKKTLYFHYNKNKFKAFKTKIYNKKYKK